MCTLYSCGCQGPLQCRLPLLLVRAERGSARRAYPQHRAGADLPRHRWGHSDAAQPGWVHGAQRQGEGQRGEALGSTVSYFFNRRKFSVFAVLHCFFSRVLCHWGTITALCCWASGRPSVEPTPRPCITKSLSFRRAPPPSSWSLSSGRSRGNGERTLQPMVQLRSNCYWVHVASCSLENEPACLADWSPSNEWIIT